MLSPHPLPSALPVPLPGSDRPDLGTIYRDHAATVSRWAARLGGPRVDVEDVVHDVFLVAQRRLPEFRHEAKITTWLFAITRLVAHQHRRLALGRWSAPEVDGAPPGSASGDGDDRLVAALALRRALGEIQDDYRTAVLLFDVEGWTGEEIARSTGASLANVWVRIFRGRGLVAERLAEGRKTAGPRRGRARARGAAAPRRAVPRSTP